MPQVVRADQVIGKTLFAARPVPVYRTPDDKSKVVFTVKPGQAVGQVYSYIKKGNDFYWMMYDENQKPYYAKHGLGNFSLDLLRQQGTKTDKDLEADKGAEKNMIYSLLRRAMENAAVVALAALLLTRKRNQK